MTHPRCLSFLLFPLLLKKKKNVICPGSGRYGLIRSDSSQHSNGKRARFAFHPELVRVSCTPLQRGVPAERQRPCVGNSKAESVLIRGCRDGEWECMAIFFSSSIHPSFHLPPPPTAVLCIPWLSTAARPPPYTFDRPPAPNPANCKRSAQNVHIARRF